jgi:hypothetical protein
MSQPDDLLSGTEHRREQAEVALRNADAGPQVASAPNQ